MATVRAGHTWIDREHLLPRTDHARVILLDAPGGWGKTTLAEQAIARFASAAARVRLEDDTAADALVAALRRGLRRAGVSDLADLAASDVPDGVADAMLSALAQRAEPVVVFVDEGQFLDDDASRWLRAFADDLPSPHRLIVAGRALAPRLVRRPRRDVVHITIDDLRFDLSEAAAVLGVSTDAAAPTRVGTDGWPAAVGLASLTRTSLSDNDWGSGAALDSLLDRLIDDVLGADRQLVAPLAWLPLLSVEAASAITDGSAFQRLRTSGLPVRFDAAWFRLADPVREALRTRNPPDEAACATVARLYDLPTAASFLVACDHLDALADELARRHWTELQVLGTSELETYVRLIGETRLRGQPAILLNAARATELRDMTSRHAWIALGSSMAEAGSRVDHELRAEGLRDAVRTADRDHVITDGVALLDALDDTELTARGRTLLALGIAHAFHSRPDDLARADPAFDEAASLFRVLGEQRWEADAMNRLAVMVSYHGGRISLAADQQAASLALLPAGSAEWAVGMTYYAEMLDYLGRSVESEAAAREAWEVGQRLGDSRVSAYGAWTGAVVAAHRHDREAVDRWLAETEGNAGPWLEEVTGQEFLAFAADILCGLGEEERSRVYRDRVAARVGNAGTRELLDVLDGRLEAMFGDATRGVELFDRLDGEPYATIRTKWVRHLFRAVAAKRLGDRPTATRHVQLCLDLVEQMGVPDLPQRHEPLLVQMLADVWPGGPAASGTGRTRVVLLGGFNVLNGAEIVTPAPGNSATLVKVLAMRKVLTTEQVIDLLWPDADVATGRSRVRNLLNRVRTQTGTLIVRRGESIELADDVDIDVDQFESGVATAMAADATDRAGLARLALNAYTGELLPADAYDDWAAGPRERLRRRYLSLIDIVAADALERGDLDEGVRLLDMGIEAEPLEEKRYTMAATALIDQGRRAAARDVVQRGYAALDALGMPPGQDLARVGRSLDVD